MHHPKNTLSLVADIGGTNTRCALADGTTVLPDTIRRYANTDFSGLETVLRQYLTDENNVDPIAACIAVAGPVLHGVGTLTNLDWKIDDVTLANATKAETVTILNDLQAQGHAIPHLPNASIRRVLTGSTPAPEDEEMRLVVGVGTGFNAAPIIKTKIGTVVPASEAGHVDLPAQTEEEIGLAQFLTKTHGFAAVEDALSGRGLENIYDYFGDISGDKRHLSAKDIMQACVDNHDERALQTVQLFVQLLGKVCGNLSLIQLPFGGVHLVGGVARAMVPHLERFRFAAHFSDKGRFSEFMGKFNVSVVEDDYAALIGSASHLTGLMQQTR